MAVLCLQFSSESDLLPPHALQASQLGVYRAFVDNYKVAVETADKCCQANTQFAEISEVCNHATHSKTAAAERLMLYSCPGQVMTGQFQQSTQTHRGALIVLMALWGGRSKLNEDIFLTIPSRVIFLPESQGQKHKRLQRPVI